MNIVFVLYYCSTHANGGGKRNKSIKKNWSVVINVGEGKIEYYIGIEKSKILLKKKKFHDSFQIIRSIVTIMYVV